MSDAIEDRRGHCYDLAAEYVLEHGKTTGYKYIRLCHGWPVLTAGEHEGQRYGHAWVERSEVHSLPFHLDGIVSTHSVELTDCWDTLTGTWIPKALYYMGGNIESDFVTRYSFAETREMILTTEEYGPWVDSPYVDMAPFLS